MVGLRDILREPDCKQEGPVDQVAQPSQYQLPVMEHTVTEVMQCSDQLPVMEHTVTEVIQCSDQLPVLTNAEVEEVLRGLEETFSAAEVEELLRGLEETSNAGETSNTKETSDVNESSGHYIDNELDAVLNMCTDDYIV